MSQFTISYWNLEHEVLTLEGVVGLVLKSQQVTGQISNTSYILKRPKLLLLVGELMVY
jgi:hypothetical protein